ncbi:MAG: hypothetical protein KF795_33370 [Labilithrix sp.]|nr:hypothetical protein [Labilithrix sp.]
MKKLRVFAVTGLASMVGFAAFIAACGDDDLIVTDGGPDGQADTAPDGTADDGGTDAPSDARPDVVTVPDFVAEIEGALCGSLTRCCFGSATVPDGGAVDGGTYNGGKCLGLVRNLGFEFSSVGAEYVDAGTVEIDSAKATACSNQLKALACNLTGQQLAATRKVCFEAFVGKRTAGQSCAQSIECQPGQLCDPDGGTCAPLRGDGGSCHVYVSDPPNDIIDSVKDEEACSTRGSGDTKLRCASYDFDLGDYLPRAQWTCQPQVEFDAGCNSTVWCKDSVCDPFEGYYCKSPVPYFDNYCPNVLDP